MVLHRSPSRQTFVRTHLGSRLLRAALFWQHFVASPAVTACCVPPHPIWSTSPHSHSRAMLRLAAGATRRRAAPHQQQLQPMSALTRTHIRRHTTNTSLCARQPSSVTAHPPSSSALLRLSLARTLTSSSRRPQPEQPAPLSQALPVQPIDPKTITSYQQFLELQKRQEEEQRRQQSEQDSKSSSSEPKERYWWVKEAGWTALLAAQLVSFLWFVRQQIGEVMNVTGPSMLPTFKQKDDIVAIARTNFLVEALDWMFPEEGFTPLRENRNQRELEKERLSDKRSSLGRTFARLFSKSELLLARGDIVVCRSVRNPNTLVCKRIVGLEGDVVLTPDFDGSFRQQQVPFGMLFIQGDNLPDSTDSRSYGCVPRGLVHGKAVWKWSSVSRSGPVIGSMQHIHPDNVVPAELVPEGWTALVEQGPKERYFSAVPRGAESIADILLRIQSFHRDHTSSSHAPEMSEADRQRAALLARIERLFADGIEAKPVVVVTEEAGVPVASATAAIATPEPARSEKD
jgi:signal peptidase I